MRPKCPLFLGCSPIVSCLGKNLCSEGYDGDRCALCLKGKYYRVDGECIKCPNNMGMVLIGFVFMGVAFGAGAFYLNKKNVGLALVSIGVDFAQVLSSFSRVKIKWPPVVKQLFKVR